MQKLTMIVFNATLEPEVIAAMLQSLGVGKCTVLSAGSVDQVPALLSASERLLFGKSQLLTSGSNGIPRQLTPKESEIFRLVVEEGLKNRQIAERLGIVEGTVKVYMGRIFNKTGCPNRQALVLWANRSKD